MRNRVIWIKGWRDDTEYHWLLYIWLFIFNTCCVICNPFICFMLRLMRGINCISLVHQFKRVSEDQFASR